ncbi:MAG: hypothetical protein II964_06020, partial [Synergistaceae bacterium]|nr:hypothetical protein [Synergistaceae bacterium]
MSFQDTLKRIQEENSLNNISINNPPVITVDEDNNNSNESSLGSLLSAFGIGASNMVNNTVLGGVLGQFPGFLGSYVEKFSPFSGEQNEDVLRLVKMGFPLKEAREIYPYRDSWLTSLGKSSLALNNYIGDYIQDWRNNTIGDNPTYAEQAVEGAGSSVGFMGTGLLTALGTGNPFLGAIASGATEALSESGGVLADAYRQGMYREGLEAANKSFLANLALNSVLNAFLGPFSKGTAAIRNPITRHLAGTAGQVLNEIIQEPSQKVIENAANESLNNGGEFVSALGGQIPQWGDYFSELAPSVTASTLITQGLLGLGGLANPNIRQSWARQYVHRNEGTKQAQKDIQAHYDSIEALKRRIEREQAGNNNQAVIDSLNSRIEKRMRQIQNITDAFRLYDFKPSQENSNNDDFTADVALDNNQSAKTKYKLVELDSIATPENLKSDNETVSNITENFDPAAFGANESYNLGAPVISPQEAIEYGNERLDALRQIYTSDPEKTSRYRNWLVDNADSFGYDSREVQHMKNPVLVRQRISEIQNNNQPSATQNAGQGNAQNTVNETLPPKKGTRKRNKNPENTAPLVPNTEEVQGENNSENLANTNPTENTPTVSETESNTHNPQMDMNTTETQRLNSLNNEAFYGNDEFYSDSGGDNSAQDQDIPETHTPDTLKDMPSITAIRNRPNIGNPGTSRFMPEVQMPQSVRFMPDIQKPAVSRNIDSTRDILTPANNNPLAEPQQNPNADITFDEALGKVAEIIYQSYNNSPNTLHPIKEIWDYTQHLPLDLAAKIDDYLNQHHIIKGFSSGNLDDATYKVNDIDALRAILPKKATTQEKQKSDTPSNATLPELENSYAGIKKDEKNAIAERKPEPQTQEAPEPEAQNTGKRIIPEGATYPRNLRQKRLTVKGLNWNGHDYGDVDFSVSWNFDYQKEGGEKREYIYIEPTKNTFIREKTIEMEN